MADTTGLLAKYKGVEGGDAAGNAHIAKFQPDWSKFSGLNRNAQSLKQLRFGAPAAETRGLFQNQPGLLEACLDVTELQDVPHVQWILTILYEMLREDSSCFSIFDDAVKNQVAVGKRLSALISARDSYCADKAAWILTAVISQVPKTLSDDEVQNLLNVLTGQSSCSELGVLEAITNLLKADTIRQLVWTQPGVQDRIFKVQARTASAPYLHKCVFAIWMLSFDQKIAAELRKFAVVKKLKDVLNFSRAEKVVRLALTVLRNLLQNRDLSEEMVEEGILESVQQLEFEKWRDAELYEDIREVCALISSEVNLLSNYERYERELQSGNLAWGFIHSSKFWAENVLKFEQNDFGALKRLALLLQSENTDATTLAVACHDIGEFVALHPLGKKMVGKLAVKERIMQLMGSQAATHREVRREALLCCQKIMLNKWQDLEKANK